MVGWHHQLNGPEFEQAPGDAEGGGSLACCSPWGCKESNMTEQVIHLRNQSKKLEKKKKERNLSLSWKILGIRVLQDPPAAGNSSYSWARPRRPVPPPGGLSRIQPWGPWDSPHDEVVPIHVWPVARAPQVARVAHHGAAPALAGVPEPVGVLAWHYLEQLLQHLGGVV